MNEVFGSSIMSTVDELSAVDSEDFDEAFESIMDDYGESIENAVNSIAGIATEGCDCCDDDCDIDDVDLSDDGDDIAEDDDDFYNTDDDLGIEDIEADEEADEVDLSETSEFDDDDEDALESAGDGTVDTKAITTIYAEDDDPSAESIDDIILDDDLDIDDDEDITSDDSDDLDIDDEDIFADDAIDDSAAEESVQTFDDITKAFNSVLDSLE